MSSSEQASDVVIVGGGIMGSSAALFLRQRGRSVTLLERALIGQQASGVNFGHVRSQGRPMSQLPLAHRSRPLWQRMKELVGEDVEYVESGNVRVCYQDRPEQVGKLEEYAVAAREAGLELELLTGNALRSRFPFLGRTYWQPPVRRGTARRTLVSWHPRSRARRRGGSESLREYAHRLRRKEWRGFPRAVLRRLGAAGADRHHRHQSAGRLHDRRKHRRGHWQGRGQAGTARADALLAARGVEIVTFRDWQKIEVAEIQRARAGSPREKFVAIEEMIRAKG